MNKHNIKIADSQTIGLKISFRSPKLKLKANRFLKELIAI